jgi:MFS family permease
VVAFAAPVAGQLVARLGPRPLLVAGLLIAGGALLGLSGIEPDSSFASMWPGSR